MKRNTLTARKALSLFLTVLMLAGVFPGMTLSSYAEETTNGSGVLAEEHYISIASDRHGNETSIGSAMTGMPEDVEYVSIIGDLVGSGSGDEKAPEFNSALIYDEIMNLGFSGVKGAADMSILWADHDSGVIDDAEDGTGIVFGMDGYGSGLMKTGYNEDGSVAYYIYGIAFYDMNDNKTTGTTGVEQATAAAADFENWIDTVTDHTIPVFVFCHVPLHYARKDNKGAEIWNKALNYAATGTETTEEGAAITRNVIYMHGHNHTTESKTGTYSGEFYIPCGSQMEVGATEGVWSTIYYTYTTAGYLNQNTTATLVTVDEDSVDLDKYQNGEVTDGVYDTKSKKSGEFASEFVTSGQNEITLVQQIENVLPKGCTVTYTDCNGDSVDVTSSGCIGLTPGEVTAKITYSGDLTDFALTNGSTQISLQPDESGVYTFEVGEEPLKVQATASIENAVVSGIKTSYTYTGSAIKPTVKVKAGGKKLTLGTDYTVKYSNCKKVGTATVKITGIGCYTGTIKKTFKITKASNPVKVKGRTVWVYYSNLKNKNQSYNRSTLITVKKAKGTVTYARVKGNSKISINKKTGIVTVKKGLKKGVYKVKIKVVASGNDNFKKKTKYAWITVKVK